MRPTTIFVLAGVDCFDMICCWNMALRSAKHSPFCSDCRLYRKSACADGKHCHMIMWYVRWRIRRKSTHNTQSCSTYWYDWNGQWSRERNKPQVQRVGTDSKLCTYHFNGKQLSAQLINKINCESNQKYPVDRWIAVFHCWSYYLSVFNSFLCAY